MIVVEPVAPPEPLPVFPPPVVPAPQAASIANNRGIPIVSAKIRDKLLRIM